MCPSGDSGDTGYIEFWADVGPSAKSTITSDRNYVSEGGRAVLWLLQRANTGGGDLIGDCPMEAAATAPDDFASLLAHGVAEVALTRSRGYDNDSGCDDGGDCDIGRQWLPSEVRVISQTCTKRSAISSCTDLEQQAASMMKEERDSPTDGRYKASRQVLLSPCMAEALGLFPDTTTPANAGCSASIVRLCVRPLQCLGPAAVVELRGPYPLPAVETAFQEEASSDLVDTGQLPPAAVIAAVSSILPCALQGEIVATGSVLHVAGLFKVIVKAVWTDQMGGLLPQQQQQQQQQRHQNHKFTSKMQTEISRRLLTTGAVRVQEATELRLESPLPREDPRGMISGIHGTSVRYNQGNLPAQSCYQQSQHATTAPCTPGAASENQQNVKVKPAGAQDSSCTVLEEDAWICRVERDFGGGGKEVKATVRAAHAALLPGSGSDQWFNSPASGLLLHGPTGAGKTLLAKAVAEHSSVPYFFMDCSSVFRRDRGKAEQHVQDVLEKAGACSPSIVLLDQVDSVSKRRPEAAGITELQVFSVLLETMDRFRRRPLGQSRVFFLATCPDAAALDPSLLQRGRLETVLLLGTLDDASRASILEIHTRDMPLQLLLSPSTTIPTSMSPTREKPIKTDVSSPRSLTMRTVTADAETQDNGSYSALYCTAKGADTLNNKEAPSVVALSSSGAAPMAGVPAAPRTRKEFIGLIARKCHGYLGSDLERLCREAAMHNMAAASADTATTAAAVNPSGLGRILAGRDEGHGEEPQDKARDRCSEFAIDVDVRGGDVRIGAGVRLQDFEAALDVVRPSSLVGRSIGMWGDGSRGSEGAPETLVGCDAAIAELRAFLLAPLANPSLLRRLGLRAATGALLHGPPGCGKTSVARALASETRGVANFLEVRCADLVDKVVGRSERSVSDLFATARAAAPCVLFLDQVEGVAARRGYHSSTEQTFDRILSTLLVEMDGVMSESDGHVVVLAATNDIDRLDPALLRPGRLDRRVYLGPPDSSARAAIFRQRLLAMPLRTMPRLGEAGGCSLEQGSRRGEGENHNDTDTRSFSENMEELNSAGAYAEWLAGETEGYSGAQVTSICHEAALAALRENIGGVEVAPRHFELALCWSRRRQERAA